MAPKIKIWPLDDASYYRGMTDKIRARLRRIRESVLIGTRNDEWLRIVASGGYGFNGNMGGKYLIKLALAEIARRTEMEK